MKSFKQYLQGKNLTDDVIGRYEREIAFYERWLLKRDKTPVTATQKDILDYLKNDRRPQGRYGKVKTKQVSSANKQKILGVLNHHYNYLTAQELVVNNPTRFIKIRGVKKKKLRTFFTDQELTELCDLLYHETYQLKTPTKQQQRDYILFTLIAYQGLQINEVDRLTIDDFDLRKATLKVYATRKTKGRTLPLKADQIGVLLLYFNEYNSANFYTSNNHVNALNKKLRTLHPKHESMMQIRGSRIVHWLTQYNLRKTQVLAGHKYISSTENYLKNNFEDLQENLNTFHPLN